MLPTATFWKFATTRAVDFSQACHCVLQLIFARAMVKISFTHEDLFMRKIGFRMCQSTECQKHNGF